MSKKNLILGGVLLALLVIAYVYKGPYQTWKLNSNKADNVLSVISVDAVSRIEIDNGGDITAFDKVGDKWLIEGTKDFWLDDDQVNAITSALEEAKKSEPELVSENADKKADFGTHDDGTIVSLASGDSKFEFAVGNTGPDFTSTYISIPGYDQTYLFKADLNSAFKRQDWYDKTIFDFDADKVAKIRFQYPTREFSIEKEEDGWAGTLPYRFSVDDEKVDDIVESLSGLRAVDIPKQTFEGTDLEKNLIIVQLTGDDLDRTLMVGGPRIINQEEGGEETEPSMYFAKRGDIDNIYLIAKEDRDELDQTITSLR